MYRPKIKKHQSFSDVVLKEIERSSETKLESLNEECKTTSDGGNQSVSSHFFDELFTMKTKAVVDQ